MVRKQGVWAALLACLLSMAVTRPAWAASTAVLTYSDTGIAETQAGSGYKLNGTTLTITAGGVYTIAGSCSEGNIEVAKGLSDVVLILDDLTLSSSQTAPIVVKKSTTATIHLEGTSKLTSAEDPANETSSDATVADAFEGAAIKVISGSSLTFCGEGTLVADGSACKNAIKGGATASLTFNGGTYVATAANNAIASDGSITINAGSFDIDAQNDGIKAVPEADDADSAGTVTINGGSFDIDVDGDGIQADANLTINNGTFDIKTLDGYNTRGTKYNTNGRTSASYTFDPDTMSCKGLKVSGDRENAERELYVTGGNFTIDCADDAIHSDAYVTITGGTFAISSGDDGMHADTTLTLGAKDSTIARDPDVTVSYSYEGLEGGTVYTYQGRYNVAAKDDGMNAAGGNDATSGDTFNPGGRPGRPGQSWGATTTSSSSYNIYLNGGKLYINCDGDGIDSNGGLYLYGGTQTVFSMRAGGDNSPLDYDGTLVIDGATIFAAGGAGMDGRVSSTGSSQRFKAVTTSFAAGTIVNVT